MDIRPRRPSVEPEQSPDSQQPLVRMQPVVGGEIRRPQPGDNNAQTPQQDNPLPGESSAVASGTGLPPVDPRLVDAPDSLLPPPAPKKHRSIKKIVLWVLIGLLVFLVAAATVGVVWYNNALAPVAPRDETKTRVKIVSGSTPTDIALLLRDKQLIRSTTAFDIYTKLAKNRNSLQAGSYALSPSQSLPDIVDILASGKTETFSIMFYPGATLVDNTDTPKEKKTDVQTVLLNAGFSQDEITAALNAQYDSPLLADKPAGASLEGYIYGDTYMIDSSMSVEQVLEVTFAEYYKVIVDNNLIEGYEKQGLTLHEGVIMASIIQSEMGSQSADMAQVAQIFLKRYSEGMPLGSDVTAYYGADLEGKPRAVSVDTPYNTRIHAGLPKGPISNPGLAALKAVAAPASGEYVYFLSGDDGKTYFATTNEQHEKNIVDHCRIGCSIP